MKPHQRNSFELEMTSNFIRIRICLDSLLTAPIHCKEPLVSKGCNAKFLQTFSPEKTNSDPKVRPICVLEMHVEFHLKS